MRLDSLLHTELYGAGSLPCRAHKPCQLLCTGMFQPHSHPHSFLQHTSPPQCPEPPSHPKPAPFTKEAEWQGFLILIPSLLREIHLLHPNPVPHPCWSLNITVLEFKTRGRRFCMLTLDSLTNILTSHSKVKKYFTHLPLQSSKCVEGVRMEK